MSWEASGAVYKSGIGPAPRKATLCALAHCMNHLTGLCNPSMAKLAAMVGISSDQARRHVRSLEADGFVSVEPGTNTGGREGATPRYTLHFDRIAATEKQHTQADPTPGVDARGCTQARSSTNTSRAGTYAAHPLHPCSPPLASMQGEPEGTRKATRKNQRARAGVRAGAQDSLSASPSSPQDPEPAKRLRAVPATSAAKGAITASAGFVSYATYRERLKAAGESFLSETDPIFDYVESVGIDEEMLLTHIHRFKQVFLEERPTKQSDDWRGYFRNSVRGNWFHVWTVDQKTDSFKWTGDGLQVRADYRAKKAAENSRAGSNELDVEISPSPLTTRRQSEALSVAGEVSGARLQGLRQMLAERSRQAVPSEAAGPGVPS